MYAFTRRPRWILSHLLVVVLMVTMIFLGFWQLHRLAEKQERNALAAENSQREPVTLAALLDELRTRPLSELQYTPVELRGTYDTLGEVAVRNRTLNGAPGRWIVTPLTTIDGGPAVAVMRGFVPQSVDDLTPPIDGVEPPAGEVRVVGYVQPTQTKSGVFGVTDPADGTLSELSRVDVGRLAQQYGALEPFWVQLREQDPPSSANAMTAVPLPPDDEGSHRGYAVQWFIFATIAGGGYPLILRRVARNRLIDGGDQPASSTDEVVAGAGPAEEPLDA